MPNWTENRIVIKGVKDILDKMLADGKPNSRGQYHFGSWFPIPETYLKYDTTNHPDGKGLEVGRPVSWEKNSPIATPELIEEFKRLQRNRKRSMV